MVYTRNEVIKKLKDIRNHPTWCQIFTNFGDKCQPCPFASKAFDCGCGLTQIIESLEVEKEPPTSFEFIVQRVIALEEDMDSMKKHVHVLRECKL